MESYSTGKLLRIALFTSTAIGLITIGPFYALSMAFGNMSQDILLLIIGISVLGVSLMVFSFWAFNIFFFRFLDQRNILEGNEKIRIILSFAILLLVLHLIKFAASYYFLENEMTERILNWKIREFGLENDSMVVERFKNPAFTNVILTFVVISVNSVILIVYRFLQLNRKKKKIENENMALRIKNIEAQNQILVQQLQPHFLFNSLSTLKSLIKKNPENAEKYLLKLSDFLRASISFKDNKLIKVSEELKLCADYLEMQKMRFGQSLTFSFDIDEKINDKNIPVFAVQILLENAIKHNSFSESSPLQININAKSDSLTVTNNLCKKNQPEYSTGTGLINLSERYKAISGDEVKILSSDKEFSVTIKALEHENSNH
ncbi:MAG: hypothetical protein A2W91_08675 [Bacteroidetes bacterium GWF2_38_335]|nr:MAG: hypothetical protein A2W91_08675 [Bacteroidetes bacterium GWF2_38_335]OFY80449.1 MAG: hypothetical protein A2281_08400 [Bacteroidetes bacterium RIFOXYA12_FULL_38_20]HBS85946.1 hypothetical protein [Bacteroidales bacterium]